MLAEPTIGSLHSASAVRKATAGGDNYIRTKRNIVKGLALNRKYNPDAPTAPGASGVIAFGKSERVEAGADLFHQACLAAPNFAVPTYVKRSPHNWEYFGQYRATGLSREISDIQKYGAKRPKPVAGVIFIEPATDPVIKVYGGGFADLETRKKVEKAAIDFVTRELENKGFRANDVSRENRGYDLHATSASGTTLLIEVKGTSSAQPRFYLTRREFKCSEERKEWKLFVVCDALCKPILHEFGASQMRDHFKFDPLAWDCTPI